MPGIFYCPECGSKLEEMSGCGVVGYFCTTCNKLVSRKKMLSEEEVKRDFKENTVKESDE